MIDLPIDHVLPALVASLRDNPSLVLEAPPGAKPQQVELLRHMV